MEHEQVFQFEKELQVTMAELANEWVAITTLAFNAGLVDRNSALLFADMFREMIHWAFLKPGTHGKPSVLLSQSLLLARDESRSSTDKVQKTND